MSPDSVRAAASPRAFTARTWIVLVCTAGVLVLAAAVLLTSGRLQSRTAPAAPAVAEQFLDAAVNGNADDWHPLLSPTLAERFDATGGTPLIGDPAMLKTLSVSYAPDSVRYMRAQSDEPTEEQHADTAIIPVQLTFALGTESPKGEVDLAIELVLSRPFAYDEAGRELENARADATPTAVGPWRVSAIVAGDDASSALPFTDSASCATATEVLVDLSDTARIDGELSDACLLEGGTLADVTGVEVDHAEFAAQMPVLSPAVVPDELTGLPATSGLTLRMHRIGTASGAFVVLIAQDESGGGHAALLALRPMAGAS